MALNPQVLFDARIYFASLDATGFSNKVELAANVADEDYTNFASGGWKQRTGGLADTQASAQMFWQATDLTYPDDVAWAQLGVNTQPLTVAPTSGAVGTLAYLTKVMETQYTAGADVGKLLMANATWAGNQALARGQILHPQGTARTSSGNGTGVQFTAGPTAAQRMYANLHVLSIAGTGSPTLTVTVQSSVDNTFAAPTTRISFTAATALGGQALSVLGSVTDTWWRAVWTISGSTPSFLFAVSAGVAAK